MPRILLLGEIKYKSFSLPLVTLFVTVCHAFVTRLSGFDLLQYFMHICMFIILVTTRHAL
jgi:hypothetical protein